MMKKLVLILLMIIFPMTVFANEVKTPQLFIEEYDVNPVKKYYEQNQFAVLMGGEEEISNDKKPYNYIVKLLQKHLKSKLTPSQSQADYHVIFINIPITYENKWKGKKLDLPNLDPPISKNKYEGDINIVPYRFVSPWMRGTIYIKDEKPVGGTIIFPISQLLRIRELYYAAHNNWDKFAQGNPTNLNDVTMSYEDVYKPALEKYKKMFLDNFSGRPTEEQIDKIFSPDGMQPLMWARLARMAPQTTIVRFSGSEKSVECLRDSVSYYTRLYEYMFSKLLQKTIAETNNNIVHHIVPPTEILQSIHSSSGNYNCFSKYLKDTEQ